MLFWVPVMRQNYQDPLGMSKKFRQRLKMIALRWSSKLQKWFLGFWHLLSLSMAARNVQKFHFRLKTIAYRLCTKKQSGFKLEFVFIIFPKYRKTPRLISRTNTDFFLCFLELVLGTSYIWWILLFFKFKFGFWTLTTV